MCYLHRAGGEKDMAMKDAFWFRHDSNSRNDSKVIRLRRLVGWEGYGVFWAFIEALREADNYRLPTDAIEDLQFSFGCRDEIVHAIFECELLSDDGVFFWSESLCNRMSEWDRRKAKLSQAGRKGGKNKQGLSEAKAGLKGGLSDDKARREEKRREEEKREEKKERRVYNPKAASATLAWIDDAIWAEWVDHKRKVKAAVSERAIKRNIAKLRTFGEDRANELLALALDRGWRDIYDNGKPRQQVSTRDRATAEAIAILEED
jgi:hypothetical protein